MPYRDLYRQTSEKPVQDSAEIRLAIEQQTRFGHLETKELWPASVENPFEAENIYSFAVSADGNRSLICSYKTAWLLDTQSMRSLATVALPSYGRIAALNHDGSVAALVCEDSLYRWRGDKPVLERVWTSPGLKGTEVLELSADGTVAVTSHYSQRAIVRVFDFASKTLVHSFQADSDECLALHPSGRHIICFGDSCYATIHSPDGISSRIPNTTGGAFSPDGKSLCINNTNREKNCSIYSVFASDYSLQLEKPERKEIGTLSRWDFQARYAPDGKSVLLAADSDHSWHLNIDKGTRQYYDFPLGRKTAITASNESILHGPISQRSLGVSVDGVAVIQIPTGKHLGLHCATRSKTQTLVGITIAGFYGSAETSEALGDEHQWPYERPAIASQLLAQQEPRISDDEVLRFAEIGARRRAWHRYIDRLVADLGYRELVEYNQGIIGLTPELVHRATSAAALEPHFGKVQLTHHTLKAVSEELKSLSSGAKRSAFEDMLARLRKPLQDKAAATQGIKDWISEELVEAVEESSQSQSVHRRSPTIEDSLADECGPDLSIVADGESPSDQEIVEEDKTLDLVATSQQSLERKRMGWPAKASTGVILTGLAYALATITGLL